MNKYTVTISAMVLALTGCATPEERAEEARQDRIEARNEQLQAQVESLPGWVLETPKSDATGYFAVGIGKSGDLNMALKKARMEAEFALAKQYSQMLSGSERMYQTDSAISQEKFVALIDKVVDEVPIVGYSVENQKIVVSDGQYNAYMLLKLPYDEFNAVLKQQRAKALDSEMKDAFAELEKRLAARRQLAKSETLPTDQPDGPHGGSN